MIRASGVSVRIRHALAVDGVDLDLGPGVHGVLGSNGAGKSTLIRALATAAAVTEGSLELLGRDPGVPAQRLEIRRRLGYLPQEYGVYRGFTVREFLSYVAWLKEMPGPRIPRAVEDAAERVGLADRVDRKLRSLSGGMRQRAGIAQAIVNGPELLVLDEPTPGLDLEHRAEFHELLREMRHDTCVVLSTHLLEDIEEACTSATVLSRGRVTFHGGVGELAAAGGPAAVLRRDRRTPWRRAPDEP